MIVRVSGNNNTLLDTTDRVRLLRDDELMLELRGTAARLGNGLTEHV